MSGPPTRHGQPDNERLGLYVIAGAIALVFLIALSFVYLGNLAGFLVIIATAGLGLWALVRTDRRGQVEVATPVDDAIRRTLVFVDTNVDPESLREHLARLEGRRRQLHLLVPARTDLAHRAASDVDGARERAGSRLAELRSALSGDFDEVGGAVGDSDDRLALEDALRTYPADELILVNPPEGERERLQDVVARRSRDDVPLLVTEATVRS